MRLEDPVTTVATTSNCMTIKRIQIGGPNECSAMLSYVLAALTFNVLSSGTDFFCLQKYLLINTLTFCCQANISITQHLGKSRILWKHSSLTPCVMAALFFVTLHSVQVFKQTFLPSKIDVSIILTFIWAQHQKSTKWTCGCWHPRVYILQFNVDMVSIY